MIYHSNPHENWKGPINNDQTIGYFQPSLNGVLKKNRPEPFKHNDSSVLSANIYMLFIAASPHFFSFPLFFFYNSPEISVTPFIIVSSCQNAVRKRVQKEGKKKKKKSSTGFSFPKSALKLFRLRGFRVRYILLLLSLFRFFAFPGMCVW